MRLLFIINTPGQAHTWKHVITNLQNRGDVVKIIARDYGSAPVILRDHGLQFEQFSPVGSRVSRLAGALSHFSKVYQLSRGFSPSIVIGFGIDAAVTAVRLRRPCIVFIDDDHTPVQNLLTSMLGSTIITPDCFKGNLGKRHIRVKGYKELAYIHPNYFTPDAAIFDELKVARDEKYVILRFNSFDAVHDIGSRGFSNSEKFKLVEELGKQARVFISPEAPLPGGLEKYRLPVSYTRFHQAIYHAQMFVGDTATATEAALLGTAAVLCCPNETVMGNFQDLEKYGLLFCYHKGEAAIQKAAELIQQRGLKEEWAGKRKVLLADKMDVGLFLSDFIHGYPAHS
jgi:uncharacterized protein